MMRALAWRTPDSFSSSTGKLARESLSKDAWQAMDSLLSISAHVSAIDAYWTSELLSSLTTGTRDGFWCAYLHKQYEDKGIVNASSKQALTSNSENLRLTPPRGGH